MINSRYRISGFGDAFKVIAVVLSLSIIIGAIMWIGLLAALGYHLEIHKDIQYQTEDQKMQLIYDTWNQLGPVKVYTNPADVVLPFGHLSASNYQRFNARFTGTNYPYVKGSNLTIYVYGIDPWLPKNQDVSSNHPGTALPAVVFPLGHLSNDAYLRLLDGLSQTWNSNNSPNVNSNHP